MPEVACATDGCDKTIPNCQQSIVYHGVKGGKLIANSHKHSHLKHAGLCKPITK